MTAARNRRRRPAPAATQHPVELPRELWLAGLGAVAATGETAQTAFGALVARGRRLEPAVLAAAESAVEETLDAARRTAREAAGRSREIVDRALARLVPAGRTSRSKNFLHRLGDLAEALR